MTIILAIIGVILLSSNHIFLGLICLGIFAFKKIAPQIEAARYPTNHKAWQKKQKKLNRKITAKYGEYIPLRERQIEREVERQMAAEAAGIPYQPPVEKREPRPVEPTREEKQIDRMGLDPRYL